MSSKKLEKQNQNHQQGGDAAAAPSHCRFGGCKHKVTKFGFCQEHYEMYMDGVIRGDGSKPVDFEKKMERYLANRKVA